MCKSKIIQKIKKFSPDLVWEIDKPEYYGSIGWKGSVQNTYWFNDGLNGFTVKILSFLLVELKNQVEA